MNLEDRLNAAAQETNRVAGQSAAPPIDSTERVRPWLAFSAALAVVIAIIGIPPLVANFGADRSSDGGPLAGPEETTTTQECIEVATTTVVEEGGVVGTLAPMTSAAFSENVDVIVFLKDEGVDGVVEGDHLALLAEVESWDEVASATYYDNNAAWAEYQQVFADQPELLDIDPAILPASIRIELTDIEFESTVQVRLEQMAPVVGRVATSQAGDLGSNGGVTTAPPTTLVGDSGDVEYLQTPECFEPVSTATWIGATTTGVGFVCEASDYGPPTTIAYSGDDSDRRDLTEPVRDKLTRLAEAARHCDYNAIAALAADDITTSFGGGGVENIALWHDEGVEVYAIINELFNMSHGVTEMDDGSRLYVWPAAFAHDSWDQIPEAEITELLRLYTQDELDQLSQLGSYGGWRIGITESGDWIFFVAGD